jgi:dihydrofolate synthase / folylpolyglutamate synthase
VRRRARRVGAPLREVAAAPLLGWDRDGIVIELPGLGATRVGLRGRHQAENAAVADAVLDALAAADIASTSPAARREGFAAARWPGRLELLVVAGREVLLDGAHNPAAAATLAVALDDLRPHLEPGPLTLVHGATADHDARGVIERLASAAALRGARIITTQLASPRASPADVLAARWRDVGTNLGVTTEPDVDRALRAALESDRGPVVVTGSLYLVGEARARWLDDPLLRDPEVPAT